MIPRATYRLQLTRSFGFGQAAQLAAYLQQLGISHAYLSPYLKARPGSPHGYDIVDHAELNAELGDAAAFQQMCAALKGHQLGHVLDFVPNHMGVGGADNPLWLEVLELGPDAPHAGWFDIEWDPERRYLHNKLLVPLLADQYGVELARAQLRLRFDPAEGSFAVWAYDTHKLPIYPPDYARIFNDGSLGLDQLSDAFGWLPNTRGLLPRRAAELKARLAAEVRDSAEASAAIATAVSRFDGREGEADSWEPLHRLIQRQHWRLAHFRVAADDINYRRFFNINDLAGLRMELPEVFDHAHQRVLRLVREGVIDGLRIDHIDGLYDPKGYLKRLARRLGLGARRPERHFYLVVEKILSAHEHLREDWPIDGTTGYDFLNQVLSLLVDPAAEAAFTEIYQEFSGEKRSYSDITRLAKLHIMDNEMAGELNMLARDMARLARQNPRCADFTQNLLRRAIKQIIACFPVYRTYLDGNGELDAADQRDIAWALARARRYETEIDPSVFGYLEQVLTGRLLQQPRRGFSYQSLLRAAMRLQQYSGPVDAKGMEDTALYRYNRLIALNEVGGDPERFGGTVAAFHRACQLRAQRWPNAMLTLATHDTKRGADARARLAALSELPEEWREQLPVWSRILRGPPAQNPEALRPDRNDEYLLYQMLLGSWPTELLQITPADIETPDSRATAALHAYAARIRATMTKSMREARVHTNWAFPTAEYEDAMLGLIDAALTGNRATAFLGAFVPFARRVAGLGAHNSLVQMVLALTTPGVPDLYNGTELWDFSLVDPDNRAPIDFAQCQRLLQDTRAGLAQDRTGSLSRWLANWSTGQIKLAVTLTLLEFRREHPALLAAGDYQPLTVMGSEADEICAFARTQGEQSFICAVARFPRRREQHDFSAEARLTRMPALPGGPWRELLSGRVIQAPGEELPARELFAVLPAAVLVAVPAGS